ncbi:uncharacterized protein LOC129571133 isoform X2 [Sitodiplosis mosellana]|uniref:uncharacterized protein LOC129571133 isoform X2 n=1 Tax=Sitodiplosis mosellana TaxID=263140 RepID=UPI0024451E04|nr:uncharacterized protein LOC129571133 isoform X2 [Sitodiplosis mosellana]
MELEEASSSSVKDPRPSLGSRLNPVYQYLIGDAIETFVEQLPTEMDVVKLFCFEWDDHKSANEKMTRVVNSIKTTWSRAGLPQRSITSIRTKVKNLIATFKSIVSSRTKGTASQGKKENDFLNKSKRLFDIIDQKSEPKLNAIKKAFLSDQRDDRRLTFFDLNLNEDDGMIVGDGGSGTSNELMSLVPEDDDDDTEMCSEQEYKSDSESNYYPTSSDDEDYQPKKKLKTETINAMHDAGLSFRQMHKVSEAFIKQFDENLNDYCIAPSTFHSKSTKLRKNTYEEISEQMKERNSKLVILFDTKTCDQLNAVHLQKQKRLAVVLYNERCHYGVCICTVFLVIQKIRILDIMLEHVCYSKERSRRRSSVCAVGIIFWNSC